MASTEHFLCVPLCTFVSSVVNAFGLPYLVFGGTVNPKTEIRPDPATFSPPESSGFGK